MSTQPVGPMPTPKRMPTRIFVIEMAYLVLLIGLLVVFKTDHAFRDELPAFGKIPVEVVWFGAVGGVLAGLGGVFFHNADWNPTYNYWHYSRPLVGGVAGGVGCLLFYVSILVGTKSGVTPRVDTFDAVAFLLGFADEAFREQMTKLTKLLFGPGETNHGAAGDGGHKVDSTTGR
jgi:hypothetical protein